MTLLVLIWMAVAESVVCAKYSLMLTLRFADKRHCRTQSGLYPAEIQYG
jgi:hypothetical protein